MNNSLDFVLCVNDSYSRYIAVTIKSICENHKHNICVIHILTDYIREKNESRLNEIVSLYSNVQLKVYIVKDCELRGIKDTWSIYAWYRILIPHLLANVDRCLYVDADTVITDNLQDLFTMPMNGKAIGCVIDVENFNEDTRQRCKFEDSDTYVCSGVMLMNLQYWRQYELSNCIIKWARENDSIIKFPDQDTINIICKDCKIILPIKYGVQSIFFKHKAFFRTTLKKQLVESFFHPSIIHYAGCAPWIKEFSSTLFHYYWMRYNVMLKHKVKLHYKTKGLKGLKVRVWRLMHPYNVQKEKLAVKRLLQLP